jgi:hypothetical protein
MLGGDGCLAFRCSFRWPNFPSARSESEVILRDRPQLRQTKTNLKSRGRNVSWQLSRFPDRHQINRDLFQYARYQARISKAETPWGRIEFTPGQAASKSWLRGLLHIREVFAKPRGNLTLSAGKALGINPPLRLDERIFYISF